MRPFFSFYRPFTRRKSVTTEFTNVSYLPDGDDLEVEERRLCGGASLSSAPAALMGIGRSAPTHPPHKMLSSTPHEDDCNLNLQQQQQKEEERHLETFRPSQMESFRSAPRTFIARFGAHRSYSPQLTRLAPFSTFSGAGPGAEGLGTTAALGTSTSTTGTAPDVSTSAPIHVPRVHVTSAAVAGQRTTCADSDKRTKDAPKTQNEARSTSILKEEDGVGMAMRVAAVATREPQPQPQSLRVNCTRRILAPKPNETLLLPSSSSFGTLYFHNS